MDELTAVEIKRFAEHIRTHVVSRRNARGGRSAAEHFIAAVRCVYNHAVAGGLLRKADNPRAEGRQVPEVAVHAPRVGG